MRPSDIFLPVALGLWLFALRGVNANAMNDWGLLAALPVTFFVGLAVLVLSIGLVLADKRLSPVRIVLHLVALVLVLHGTVPLVFPQTNYPWAYKHMGVVGNVALRGRANSTIDIYQNWPGFFAAGAWFDSLAGAQGPLSYAKWAPVYFNLLFCLEMAFVVRWLPLGRRERWLSLFLFVAGNWVGQDYFAPQSLALVLCLAVFGMVLAWFQVDRRPALVRAAGRVARRLVMRRRSAAPAPDLVPPGAASAPVAAGTRLEGWSLVVRFGLLFGVFTVVVATHQLSPYLVVSGIALLTAAGLVRPRWLVVCLGAVTLAYLVPHLPFLRSSHNLAGSPFNVGDVLNALSNPFDNLQSSGFGGHPLQGRSITSLGAPALILGLGLLGLVGAIRRLRADRPALLLLLLAGSPVLLAFGQNYGGEAIFRIYLFSLPWLAPLAASALMPRTARWGRLSVAKIVVAIACVVVLFMSAFYGSVELYRVSNGAVAVSQYFYDHAPPGSVLGLGAPNFPGRLGANYDEFRTGSTPPPLTTLPQFQGHLLGPADVVALEALYQGHVAATTGRVYLCLGADQDVYAEVLGFMPKGSILGLDRALAASPRWRVAYRNGDTVLYEFLPGVAAPR